MENSVEEITRRPGRPKGRGPKTKLLPRQRRFCVEYCLEFNATQAYITAYQTKKKRIKGDTAKVQASLLLAQPMIKQEIERICNQIIEDKTALTAQVLQEYKLLAFSDIRDYAEYKDGRMELKSWTAEDGTEVDTRGIQSIDRKVITYKGTVIGHDVRVTVHNKLQALAGLAQFLKIAGGEMSVKFDFEDARKQVMEKLKSRMKKDPAA